VEVNETPLAQIEENKMKRYTIGLITGILLMSLFIFQSCDSSKTPSKQKTKSNTPPVNLDLALIKKLKQSDCAEFIKLLTAKEVAKDTGYSEQWVVANYRVNVWELPIGRGRGKKVGEMYASSRALLLDQDQSGYKIQSPLDKSIGWVSNIQVGGTVKQNPITYESCQ